MYKRSRRLRRRSCWENGCQKDFWPWPCTSISVSLLIENSFLNELSHSDMATTHLGTRLVMKSVICTVGAEDVGKKPTARRILALFRWSGRFTPATLLIIETHFWIISFTHDITTTHLGTCLVVKSVFGAVGAEALDRKRSKSRILAVCGGGQARTPLPLYWLHNSFLDEILHSNMVKTLLGAYIVVGSVFGAVGAETWEKNGQK